MTRWRVAGTGAFALLLLAAVAGCTASRSPPTDLGASPLDLPTGLGDPVLPEECSAADVQGVCTTVRHTGMVNFVDLMPQAEPLGPPEVTALPDGRVRYVLFQRAPGGADSAIIDDYEFVFGRWDPVQEGRRLLVYRKRVAGVLLEAVMRLVRDGPRHVLEATLTTVEPIVR